MSAGAAWVTPRLVVLTESRGAEHGVSGVLVDGTRKTPTSSGGTTAVTGFS
ncbi:MAG: hypothetical protein QG597_3213 [Actinomycetota bacterium]|nr:hypothetical protein [Actinomycetota bacterium]